MYEPADPLLVAYVNCSWLDVSGGSPALMPADLIAAGLEEPEPELAEMPPESVEPAAPEASADNAFAMLLAELKELAEAAEAGSEAENIQHGGGAARMETDEDHAQAPPVVNQSPLSLTLHQHEAAEDTSEAAPLHETVDEQPAILDLCIERSNDVGRSGKNVPLGVPCRRHRGNPRTDLPPMAEVSAPPAAVDLRPVPVIDLCDSDDEPTSPAPPENSADHVDAMPPSVSANAANQLIQGICGPPRSPASLATSKRSVEDDGCEGSAKRPCRASVIVWAPPRTAPTHEISVQDLQVIDVPDDDDVVPVIEAPRRAPVSVVRRGRPAHTRRQSNVVDLPVSQDGGSLEQQFSALPHEQQLKIDYQAVREYASTSAFGQLVTQNIREYAVRHNFPAIIDKPQALLANAGRVNEFLQQLIEPELAGAADDDILDVEISHDDLPKPIHVHGRRGNFVGENGIQRAQQIINTLFRMSQSAAPGAVLRDGLFTVRTTTIDSGRGSGRHGAPRRATDGVNDRVKVSPPELLNYPNACGYQSLLLGRLFAEMPEGIDKANSDRRNKWRALTMCIGEGTQQEREKRVLRQTSWAQELEVFAQRVGVSPAAFQHPMTFESLAWLCRQDYLKDFRVLVVKRPDGMTSATGLEEQHLFLNVLFDNGNMTSQKHIFLEFISASDGNPDHPDGHYNMIRNLPSFFGFNGGRFCSYCCKFFKSSATFTTHVQECRGYCDACCYMAGRACGAEKTVQCPGCRLSCYNQACLARHQRSKCCDIKRYCETCMIIYDYDKKRQHRCDWFFCRECEEEYQVSPHHCHIRPLKVDHIKKQGGAFAIRVYFDIETYEVQVATRSKTMHDGSVREEPVYELRPTLVSYVVACDNCEGVDGRAVTHECLSCSKTAVTTYYGDDCIKRFLDDVMQTLARKAEEKKGRVFVFAHNFKGFDSQFIMQEIDKDKYLDVKPIFVGRKILKMDISNVRFMDSYALMPQALASLPKSFGFADELRSDGRAMEKDFFPYRMPRPPASDADKELPFPSREMFGEDFMTPQRALKFAEYYEANKHRTDFKYRSTLQSYCEQDCWILAKAVNKFRLRYEAAASYDPTQTMFTLAGCALQTYRACCMDDVRIGVPPQKGYFHHRLQSKIGEAWLNVTERRQRAAVPGFTIQREQRVGNFFVDGAVRDHTQKIVTVYEFDGCYWHGCDVCGRAQAPDADARRARTTEKLDYLQKRGIDVITMRECEAEGDAEVAEEHRRITALYQILDPPGKKVIERSALYGGRVECFAAHVRLTEEQLSRGCEIRYVDFVSLYPTVLKQCDFPLGHPDVLTDLTTYVKGQFFGLVHCKVLAPRALRIPVLPYRTSDKKLLFGLCRTCCETYENKAGGVCAHTEDERAFEGMWPTVEVDKAIDKGYVVVRANAGLAYRCHDNNMFRTYVDMFMKIKVEASGYDRDDMTDQEKQEFCDSYFDAEGILINPCDIEKNPGLRTIAKLLLNSLWGKLSQRRNRPKTIVARTMAELTQVISDPLFKVMGVRVKDNQSAYITYKYAEEDDSPCGNTSTPVASFVTSHARLRLYELMEKVKPERILYVDTDSMVYVFDPDDGEDVVQPMMGPHLGQLTNEVPTGSKCIEGIFAGAKSYHLVYQDANMQTTTLTKMKGVSQCLATKDTVSGASMAAVVGPLVCRRNAPHVSEVVQGCLRIKDIYDHVMQSMTTTKLFRNTNYKRVVLIGGTESVPHGFNPSYMSNPHSPVNVRSFIQDDEVLRRAGLHNV